MGSKDVVSYEDAVQRLPDGETVHTFRGFIGADWSRQTLLEAIQKYGVEEAGPFACAMGHGLVLRDDIGLLFIETKEGDGGMA